MNFKLTSRVKVALLSALVLISLLFVFISFDAFGIRSYNPSNSNALNGSNKTNSNQFSLLFKPFDPVTFDDKDLNFLDTDFFNQLSEVPLRKTNPVGIVNRGCSCYADSVIQMLFRIGSIRKIVANLDIYNRRVIMLEERRTIRRQELKNLREALSVIQGLNHMFHQLQNNKTEDATFEFGKTMQCLPGKFAKNNQEDADEYFTFIIGKLMDIIPKAQHRHLGLRVSFNGTLTSKSDPLKTQPKQQTDVETRISLPFNGEGNLKGLLDVYFAPETADLNFDDGTPGTLVRSKRLDSLPRIITIHLQRLSTDFDAPVDDDGNPKIIRKGDTIDMPDDLDLSTYTSVKSNTKYRLKMFVVHSGTASGGHYYAYTRFNDSWCTLNDTRITLKEEDDVVEKDKNTGYLYFYERLN